MEPSGQLRCHLDLKKGQKVSNDILGTGYMGCPKQDVVAHGGHNYMAHEVMSRSREDCEFFM